MKIDNNIFIKSLYLTEHCYAFFEETYEYKFNNNKGQIDYYLRNCGISPLINVKDNTKFSNQIFEIVKDWKHKYYWNDFIICDGTMWELKIKLSNGKYLKYEGHQMFPTNYKRLKGYLNRYVGHYVKKYTKIYNNNYKII